MSYQFSPSMEREGGGLVLSLQKMTHNSVGQSIETKSPIEINIKEYNHICSQSLFMEEGEDLEQLDCLIFLLAHYQMPLDFLPHQSGLYDFFHPYQTCPPPTLQFTCNLN